MNPAEFNKIISEASERSQEFLHKKGCEYAQRGKDRLTQFKTIGNDLSIEPVLVACVLAAKHWDCIAQMASHHRDYPVSLWRDKLDDLRNYTYFIEAILIDEATDN